MDRGLAEGAEGAEEWIGPPNFRTPNPRTLALSYRHTVVSLYIAKPEGNPTS